MIKRSLNIKKRVVQEATNLQKKELENL